MQRVTFAAAARWVGRQVGWWLCLALLGGSWLGCEQTTPARSAPQSHSLRLDTIEFTAELAITPDEMAQGLMHRLELPSNHGMLFVFSEPGRRSFWMKNTHIPLDLGYFTADGILREIHAMEPYDLTPVPSLRADILYALEMPRGWFARHGLAPGARLDETLLRRALAHEMDLP